MRENQFVEPYCLLGIPPKNADSDTKLQIGDHCYIRSHTVIYAGTKIGSHFQTGHSVQIRERCVIGDNVSIGSKTVLEHQVIIEDNVRIHTQAFIPEFTIIKKGAWIGPNVVFTNADFPLGREVKDRLQGPIIEENVIIGANSTILPGVRLGAGCLVGAGSVVTRDVEPDAVVVGNPARKIKLRSQLRYQDTQELVYSY
ncbi:MAG: N-acetyltransferase [Deferribacteres bacterium]|nr:N-acetyltransferase [candidate division KSB1 bacterium]MCB9501751.1 N-acetyltransferase [Deferribacteres bacterium]